MGTIRTIIAAMLTVFALAAFQSDAYAQSQRESRSSRSSSVSRTSPQKSSGSKSVSRSNSSNRKSSATKPSSSSQTRKSPTARPSAGSDRKPASSAARPSSTPKKKPAAAARPSNGSDRKPSGTVRPARPADKPKVTRPTTKPAENPGNRPGIKPSDRPGDKPGRPDVKPGDRPGGKPDVRPVDRPRPGGDRPMHEVRPNHKPDPHRTHPRDRHFMAYDRPSHYWSHHNHCFGHRVRVLPAHVVRHYYHGHVYYCYNDIWYRPYGSYYVVCRPPFGTLLASAYIADMTWAAVNYSYYNTVVNTYDQINENNQYIAEQNAIIAQNNATIAAQNNAIAMNQQLASQAYALSNELGLVQSYAAANESYFYQDGIFYVKDANGEYRTIVPPAGALVETLPEDYDMVTLKGDEYYKVDDTVYRITLCEGKPYFEVLGQLYQQ